MKCMTLEEAARRFCEAEADLRALKPKRCTEFRIGTSDGENGYWDQGEPACWTVPDIDPGEMCDACKARVRTGPARTAARKRRDSAKRTMMRVYRREAYNAFCLRVSASVDPATEEAMRAAGRSLAAILDGGKP